MAEKRTVTLGKYRGLTRVSDANGMIGILAVDHQDALRRALNPSAPLSVSDADLTAFKLDVVNGLRGHYTGTLLDPVWGAPFAVSQPNFDIGLLLELEKADYELNPIPLNVEVRPGWSVAKIKRMGADGVKLFFYYHPDDAAHAAVQDELVRDAVSACAAHDIPLYAEPIRFALPGEDPASAAYADDMTRVVVESARRTAALGVDVLKLEFPIIARGEPDMAAWRAACQQITDAVDVPWVLLSAGVDFETFTHQLEAAIAGGACGFIAGRAVWGEACSIADRQVRRDWLHTVGRERMTRLCRIASQPTASWMRWLQPEPVSTTWFTHYKER